MVEKAIGALGRFARVVSDAKGTGDVLSLLADALFHHVCPEGVAIYGVSPVGGLSLVAERGFGPEANISIDLDDVSDLVQRVRSVCGRPIELVRRPLVAGGNLFGDVLMVQPRGASIPDTQISLADGLVDLAAIALSTAVHVAQLERQYTELHEQQEMLARTEKLRALGQMAAGVSHDLKNILNPLSLHLQVISRAIDRGRIADAQESAAEMTLVMKRGIETLERLRNFSRQSKEAKSELVDLDGLAREAVAIGRSRAASTSGRLPTIQDELTHPAAVMAVSGEILSALVNLIVNAIDALPPSGGTISLRSGETELASWVEIADDGPGMPPEVAKRVFEPFFTTKGQEGTGLGLAMVYATMQRHGGTVTLETAEGKGTRFRLNLPAVGPNSGRGAALT